jgi:hypothetical protein
MRFIKIKIIRMIKRGLKLKRKMNELKRFKRNKYATAVRIV